MTEEEEEEKRYDREMPRHAHEGEEYKLDPRMAEEDAGAVPGGGEHCVIDVWEL